MTGEFYAPLDTLKPVGESLWIVDGPSIRFYGLPFTTRMTVIRLASGELMLHSPTRPTPRLVAAVAGLGRVAHLIAPNWIHYAFVMPWKERFPDAEVWVAPGVAERAASRGVALAVDHRLEPPGPRPWSGEVHDMLVPGSALHREVVFFHLASRTLVLTDLIENFEPRALPWWLRPLARLAGILDPDGKMPWDMAQSFRGHRGDVRAAVETMIGWAPEHVIVAHGRCYHGDGPAELRRAFRRFLT